MILGGQRDFALGGQTRAAFPAMNKQNKWSIIINALLTALTGILTAYGIL